MTIELNWFLVVLVIVPTFISALFTFLGAWLQLPLMKKKAESQVRLQAKILLFKSYEKELEQLAKKTESLEKSLGNVLHLLVDPEIEDKDKILKSIFKLYVLHKKQLTYTVNELEAKLTKYKLLNASRKKQIISLKKFISSLNMNQTQEEMEKHLIELTSYHTLSSHVTYEILEKKREQLFSDFI